MTKQLNQKWTILQKTHMILNVNHVAHVVYATNMWQATKKELSVKYAKTGHTQNVTVYVTHNKKSLNRNMDGWN